MPDAPLTTYSILKIYRQLHGCLCRHAIYLFFVSPPPPPLLLLLPSNSHSKLINIKTIAFICAIMRWFLLSSGGLTNRAYLFWVFRRQYSKLVAHDPDAMRINTVGWPDGRQERAALTMQITHDRAAATENDDSMPSLPQHVPLNVVLLF